MVSILRAWVNMAWVNIESCIDVIETTPIAGACGAQVHGVDLAAPLSANELQAIRAALHENLVIFFRDQQLDAAGLMRFGRHFGDLITHPNLKAEGTHPEVIAVRREPDDEAIIGAEWHTDTTCLSAPPMGAVLVAHEVPPVGGDTLFANQYLAYESLSDGLQQLLNGLNAVHNDTRVAGPNAGLNARRSVKNDESSNWQKTESVHPVVRTHPETGRRGLYVNVAYTRRFEGMTEAESAPLLDYLLEHSHRPEFTCRFRWQVGSVAFWDNRCLKHIALNDCRGHRRFMQRVQIAGDVPFH